VLVPVLFPPLKPCPAIPVPPKEVVAIP
jgi:hypothetical protein